MKRLLLRLLHGKPTPAQDLQQRIQPDMDRLRPLWQSPPEEDLRAEDLTLPDWATDPQSLLKD